VENSGGVCWKKLELSTEKTPTPISKNYARAGREEKGVWGK